MRLHPHAAGLFALADPDWRRKIFHGGLLLLLAPPFGWPAVLGYRSALVRRLFSPTADTLPSWRGRRVEHFREGLKAIGVIFGYLLPLYVLLAVVVAGRGFVPGTTSLLLLGFFLLFPIFSTLSFPTACLLLAFAIEPAPLSPGECAGFLGAFTAVVFLVPAGFLRVSATGRHLSAFALWRTVPFVLRHLGTYVRAWWHSGLMSLFGHLCVPFSPWGVVWCYLGIVFLFNELLLPVRGGCWMARLVADPRFERRERRGWSRIEGGEGIEATRLDLGAFSVPLPSRRRSVH